MHEAGVSELSSALLLHEAMPPTDIHTVYLHVKPKENQVKSQAWLNANVPKTRTYQYGIPLSIRLAAYLFRSSLSNHTQSQWPAGSVHGGPH